MSRRKKAEKDDSERWMISYADLLTLMLAFFIVLYSQSHLNVSRLKELAKGMIVAFHGNPAVLMHNGHGGSGILRHRSSPIPKPVPNNTPHLGHNAAQDIEVRTKALQNAAAQLKKILHPMIKDQKVKLQEKPLSLRIRLNSKILYKSGQAHLEPSARQLLNKIAVVIKKIPNDYPVVIQGYTNRLPIHNKQFRSNWELSTARSLSVVHLFLHDHLPGSQLSAQGFSKYRPLINNNSKKALRENRRVEIVIRAPNASRLTTNQASLKQAEHAGKVSSMHLKNRPNTHGSEAHDASGASSPHASQTDRSTQHGGQGK